MASSEAVSYTHLDVYKRQYLGFFFKIRDSLFGVYDHDIIFDTDDEYDIPHTPIKDVQIYRDYPSKPCLLYTSRLMFSIIASVFGHVPERCC